MGYCQGFLLFQWDITYSLVETKKKPSKVLDKWTTPSINLHKGRKMAKYLQTKAPTLCQKATSMTPSIIKNLSCILDDYVVDLDSLFMPW